LKKQWNGFIFSYTKIFHMEPQENFSLFSDAPMDNSSFNSFSDISKWTRFISITGFIVVGLIMILFLSLWTQIAPKLSALYFRGSNAMAVILLVLVIIMAIAIIWLYLLFKSSNLLKAGVFSKDVNLINEGLITMRTYFIFSAVISGLSLLSNLFSLF
jgi:hypothetical protein